MTTYVLRFAREKGRPVDMPHWMEARSRGSVWSITPDFAQAKVWKTREAADRNAARYTGGAYEFEVEEIASATPKTENATVTVTYKGKTVVVTLAGTELSEVWQTDGTIYRYFTNASREFVSGEVEKALITLAAEGAT